MEKSPKVALVEFAGSHDECLLTQMRALKSANCTVYWVTTEVMYARCAHLQRYVDHVYFVKFLGKGWTDFQTIRKLISYLKKESISKLVFNTAQGGHVRNMALLLPPSISCFGIIHTLRKFNGSFTQRIINRKIKDYLVLSDDLLKRTTIPSGLKVSSFYPVDFPQFQNTIKKPENEIWVTLTGGVETRRKDLSAMLGFLQQTGDNVRFIFLGKTDDKDPETHHFWKQVENANLSQRVTWFPTFVDQETFDAYLRNTDFLLPLIHPDTPSAEQYITNQISGAFLLAFAYHIPLLIHRNYETEADLRKSAFFYDLNSFETTLTNAQIHRRECVERISEEEKWQSAFQQRKFLRFLTIGENK